MEYLRVGKIVRPHGVYGALKVEPMTDEAARFNALSDAYLELGHNNYKPIKVVSASTLSDGYVQVKIEGIADRNAAELVRNKYIVVDREHAIKLPEGRYFVTDLIGCEVFNSDGEYIGRFSDVYETGANDVYEITVKDGERVGKLLVPALKKLLNEVDIENKRIVFDSEVLLAVGLYEFEDDKDAD